MDIEDLVHRLHEKKKSTHSSCPRLDENHEVRGTAFAPETVIVAREKEQQTFSLSSDLEIIKDMFL